MLDLLIKSAVRRKIMALFATNPNEFFYPGQIAQLIEESPHAVGLEIVHLTQGRLLQKEKRGSRIFYRWNEQYPYAELLKKLVEKMRQEGIQEVLELPSLEQEKRLKENLERIVDDLKRFYDPEKIILFGSLSSGRVGPYSDIDLVVIKKTKLPYFKRAQQLVDLLDYDVDVDFFIYNPEEFQRALKEKPFFKKEIKEKGKVLYDKAA